MDIRRVLVVFRKSLYQIYVKEHKERAFRQALDRKDKVALTLRKTHEAHTKALDQAQTTLHKLGIEVVVRWRANLRVVNNYDLVISIGGDGTLLDISHLIRDATPLVGFNSDPKKSVGALCCDTVRGLPRVMEQLASGKLRPRRLARLRVQVDGKPVLGPTLNDLLLAHQSPAGLSRFDLAVADRKKAPTLHSGRQQRLFSHLRGSGLWVATATGSTAAIHSAGGRPMAPGSRRLQFLVREPYRHPPYDKPAPLRGFVPSDQALVLVSRMRRGHLWADGSHRSVPLAYSQQVVIDRYPEDLRLIRCAPSR